MQIQAGAVSGGAGRAGEGKGRGESRPLLLDELTQYISLSLSLSSFSKNVLVCVHTRHVRRDTNTRGCKLGCLSIMPDHLFCSRASSLFLTSAAKIRLVCVLWTKEPPTPPPPPPLPVGIAQMEGKKERKKGEKGWKEEGLLLVQPHADQTEHPLRLGRVGRGGIEGLRCGTPPLVPAPHTEPQNPHTVRTWTRHICLIINEWIHAVSERHADRAARAEGSRQSRPTPTTRLGGRGLPTIKL